MWRARSLAPCNILQHQQAAVTTAMSNGRSVLLNPQLVPDGPPVPAAPSRMTSLSVPAAPGQIISVDDISQRTGGSRQDIRADAGSQVTMVGCKSSEWKVNGGGGGQSDGDGSPPVSPPPVPPSAI